MKRWKKTDKKPVEYQKCTVAFDWNGTLQLAAGTYHDGSFWVDGGDMESEIHGVEWWCGHHYPGDESIYPWVEDV